MSQQFNRQPGTYALILHAKIQHCVQIGKFGVLRTQPGFYIYVGSAFGPGGVKARLKHHMKKAAHPHWHIDYLRKYLQIEEIWLTYDTERREHCWSEVFEKLPQTEIPLPGFGASDHRGSSHLYFNKNRLNIDKFRSGLLSLVPDHMPIHRSY